MATAPSLCLPAHHLDMAIKDQFLASRAPPGPDLRTLVDSCPDRLVSGLWQLLKMGNILPELSGGASLKGSLGVVI
jgi:hypothetical protein